MVRAKMTVVSFTERAQGYGSGTVRLETQYDSTIPEDQRFCKATPAGHIEMWIDNPAAIEQLKLGGKFYVDFTPVPEQGS